MFSVVNEIPSLDESNDVRLLDGYENDTHTVFTFSRPLRSCDTLDDIDIGVSGCRVQLCRVHGVNLLLTYTDE